MDLFKWTKNLKPRFPNVIERFFGNDIGDRSLVTGAIATVSSVNVSDKSKAFEVSVIPSLDKKGTSVAVRDHRLIVSSEKQYEKEENEVYRMRREFGYASNGCFVCLTTRTLTK